MKTNRFLLVAFFAVALIFACSSDEDNGNSSGVSVSCNIDADKTVIIGGRTWMTENLNCNVKGSVCYDNDPANCAKYGRLYDWETAATACPNGWHLSSNEEWNELIAIVGGDETAGAKLKATSGWNGNGNGTDNFGFSALPGGGGDAYSGDFSSAGLSGNWWTEFKDGGVVFVRIIYHDSERISWNFESMSNKFSVRCVKN